MSNEKVSNPKVEVPPTPYMNDLDYLNDILYTIKSLVNNYSYAMNEASNEDLYQVIKDVFDDVSSIQRVLFDIMFQNGWYCLEKAENKKVKESYTKFNQQLQELN
jgi:Coat F domain.